MAVNGIEIKVGQVWRTRNGMSLAAVSRGEGDWPWLMSNSAILNDDGRYGPNDESFPYDLVELIRDEHGFTIWRGGEQPEETKGRTVRIRFVDGGHCDEPADDVRWHHQYDGQGGDIVAYKIVEERVVGMSPAHAAPYGKPDAAMPDPDALAAETLESLGWHFDGQTWVQEPELQIEMFDNREYTGGSVSYYQVEIAHPTTEGRAPYTAECNDLIEALQMNYAEANVLKALWRICAARLGRSKRGYDDGVYDAEKIGFFGARVLVQQRKEGGAA